MWMQKDFVTKTWQEQNKIMTRYVFKTYVEHIENNVRFYFYLYPLGI
jgi:hypothetical protein